MPTSIFWFRQDLRLSDNPALCAAAKAGVVIPIFIYDDVNCTDKQIGGASQWWLKHSLADLNERLGGKLAIFRGDPIKIIPELMQQHNAETVYWNRCYEPWHIKRDTKLKTLLAEQNIKAESYNASLLWEPWQVLKADQTPYKVFTPFYRKGCLLSAEAPRHPLKSPGCEFVKIDAHGFDILPAAEKWQEKLETHWQIGEEAAQKRLYEFLEQGLDGYKEGRNFPARHNVSMLSPYLHFGEISPNQVWYAAQFRGDNSDMEHFLSEIGWREFSYYLLYHFPTLPHQNLQAKFDQFPWADDASLLKSWQRGLTGYPIVDAGMRQLWQTGYMHNRVRMIVGSFLVKNLLLDWRLGEAWFWDCLLDADLANNSASWQWVAGCGADAAPYFRIFNPVTQGEKFDPDGEYIKKFVPELNDLPTKYLYAPWQASGEVLQQAGVKLGGNYPKPIIDLAASRDRALVAFHSLKK